MQSKYDTVITNFTKSGNHQSSFTRVAMKALDDNGEESNDDDDDIGVESGGWCFFTNSLPVVYLYMWLNEQLILTSFVSHKIPKYNKAIFQKTLGIGV